MSLWEFRQRVVGLLFRKDENNGTLYRPSEVSLYTIETLNCAYPVKSGTRDTGALQSTRGAHVGTKELPLQAATGSYVHSTAQATAMLPLSYLWEGLYAVFKAASDACVH